MSIIIEVKSNKGCCRKESVITEGLFDEVSKFFSADNQAAAAVKTAIQRQLAEAAFESLLGRPVTKRTKATILYKTLFQTAGMIDLKDLTGLMKGSKRICDSVAQNIIASLIKVTVNEISSELRELGTDYVGQKTGGKGAPAARAILTVLDNVQKVVTAMFAEELKDAKELQAFSSAICKIDFLDLISDIPGAETLLGIMGVKKRKPADDVLSKIGKLGNI